MSRVLEICYDLPQVTFQPGETLMTQGGSKLHMLVLISGKVEVIKDGKTIATVEEAGAIFGEIAVILNSSHNATVRAIETTEAYEIEDPRAFLWERAEFNFELLNLLAKRLDRMDQKLANLQQESITKTEASDLLEKALSKVIHEQGADQENEEDTE